MKIHSISLVTIVLLWSTSVFAGIDDASLKERLVEYYFYAGHDSVWQEFDAFKKQNAVSDEQLHRVLMAIYQETGDNRPALTPQSNEWRRNQGIAESVVRWLPKCGNVPVKDFLLERMTMKESDGHIRQQAILAYLRVANAVEAKNILLRFLVGEDRMGVERLSVYGFARTVYDESASLEKKAAILAALAVAADKEEGKIRFIKVDGILAERNVAYRQSRERLAMLERHSQEPPTANLYTDRDLKAALEESRKYKQHTSVNTNLAALKSLDFNLPQPDLSMKMVAADVRECVAAEAKRSGATRRGSVRYVFFGLSAFLLLGFGVWRFTRTHTQGLLILEPESTDKFSPARLLEAVFFVFMSLFR